MTETLSVGIALPYPPSINHYWRNVQGRTLISKRGREYREQVRRLVLAFGGTASFGRLPLYVHMLAVMPDRRKRDLDNLTKAVLDALTHAGVWEDDSQINDLRITRSKQVEKGGSLIVMITVQQDEACRGCKWANEQMRGEA